MKNTKITIAKKEISMLYCTQPIWTTERGVLGISGNPTAAGIMDVLAERSVRSFDSRLRMGWVGADKIYKFARRGLYKRDISLLCMS